VETGRPTLDSRFFEVCSSRAAFRFSSTAACSSGVRPAETRSFRPSSSKSLSFSAAALTSSSVSKWRKAKPAGRPDFRLGSSIDLLSRQPRSDSKG
jgi:hypothetical protein